LNFEERYLDNILNLFLQTLFKLTTGAAFFFEESSLALQITFRDAVLTYGILLKLYCDNGKVFVSGFIHMVCARIGTALIHSKPFLMRRIQSATLKRKEEKPMYKAFYGFTGEPFSKDAGEQALFRHSSFNELSSRLTYIKKYRGIMLLTGDPGTGKTTALRSFFASLKEQSFFPVYLPLSTVGITEFYQQINQALGGEPCSRKNHLFKSIQERILDLALNRNKVPVIVIDECHLLKNENFFELQIITNFNMDSFDPCIFILAAQSHLNDRLQRSILNSFNQRISIKYHLFPLGIEECSAQFQDQWWKRRVVHRTCL
jgi:general secretion pathway protein A